MKDGEITKDLSREEVIYLERAFWDENGLRTLELEEYRISEKKDPYQLNDESISGKGLKFCYLSTTKVGNKQKQYILNHLDFNMEYGKAIGLIGLNGTGKTTFARVISGLEKIKEGTIWAGKDKSLNHKDLMDGTFALADFLGTVIPVILFGTASFVERASKWKMSEAQINEALSYFKVSWAVGFGLITFVLACIGAFVATRILKKHFEKAGVI